MGKGHGGTKLLSYGDWETQQESSPREEVLQSTFSTQCPASVATQTHPQVCLPILLATFVKSTSLTTTAWQRDSTNNISFLSIQKMGKLYRQDFQVKFIPVLDIFIQLLSV